MLCEAVKLIESLRKELKARANKESAEEFEAVANLKLQQVSKGSRMRKYLKRLWLKTGTSVHAKSSVRLGIDSTRCRRKDILIRSCVLFR